MDSKGNDALRHEALQSIEKHPALSEHQRQSDVLSKQVSNFRMLRS
jgi:hypothetical protein